MNRALARWWMCICVLGMTACTKKDTEDPAAEADRRAKSDAALARGKKTLATLASFEAVVKATPKPGVIKSNPLALNPSDFGRNFDTLLVEELAHIPTNRRLPLVSRGRLLECQNEVETKRLAIVGSSTCDFVPYVIVLRPKTITRAQLTSATTYTAGVVDADAFVFDLATGKLLGGGHISARTPPNATLRASTAEKDLQTLLGEEVDKALQSALSIP